MNKESMDDELTPEEKALSDSIIKHRAALRDGLSRISREATSERAKHTRVVHQTGDLKFPKYPVMGIALLMGGFFAVPILGIVILLGSIVGFGYWLYEYHITKVTTAVAEQEEKSIEKAALSKIKKIEEDERAVFFNNYVAENPDVLIAGSKVVCPECEEVDITYEPGSNPPKPVFISTKLKEKYARSGAKCKICKVVHHQFVIK